MAGGVNDYCRFCNDRVRKENGKINHSKLIFEKTKNSIFQRLRGLGLTLTNRVDRSFRSCVKCDTLIKRLESALPAFRRWEENEKRSAASASSPSSHGSAPASSHGSHQAVWTTSTSSPASHVLQENGQGPPGTPVDEEEEKEDYSVGRPWEKSEHDAWTTTQPNPETMTQPNPETMTQPNPEAPPIKEEQEEFSIEVEVCPSPDDVKSEPYDHDEAEMELSVPSDDEGAEESATGDERRRSSAKIQEVLDHLGDDAYSKTPTGALEHTCSVCGRAFARKYHLEVHMRTHSGEKPYVCDVCGRAFSHSSSLTTHRTRHTGEKPYRCAACDKLFATSGRLRVHMRCHSGEKPYACDVCDKRFRQKDQMRKHRMVKHGGEAP